MTLEHRWSALIKQWKLVILCHPVADPEASNASKPTTPLYQLTTMEHFLTALAGCRVGEIIFDTPRLLGLSDSYILAPGVDEVRKVVAITNANKKSLKQAKAHLAQSECHVLGCVVNKQRQSRKDSAHYYYYQSEEDQSKSRHSGHVPSVPAMLMPLRPRANDEWMQT